MNKIMFCPKFESLQRYNPLLVILLFVFGGVQTQSNSQFPRCTSMNSLEGRCVSFHNCPTLLEILKSPGLTPSKVRFLQRMTCNLENPENPKVCCPLADIQVFPQSMGSFSPKTVLLILLGNRKNGTHVLVKEYSDAKKELGVNSEELEDLLSSQEKGQGERHSEIINQGILKRNEKPSSMTSYKNHRNFHLIPPLSKCSNIPSESDRIVGGSALKHGERPWMGRVGYRNRNTDEIEFFCAATVITNKYLLTASHCLDDIGEDYEPEVIRLAEHNTETAEDCSTLGCSRTVDYPIEKIISHRGYSSLNKSNDIGLIRVDREISFNTPYVQPVCLPFIEDYGIGSYYSSPVGQNGFVAGWGRVKWNRAEGSKSLLEINLPIISQSQCQFNYSTRVTITNKQICAGGIKGKDSCGGDSGGPMLLLNKVKKIGEPKLFQIGVVSFGPVRCGIGGLPGVYTFIPEYLNWILNAIEE